ncbi:hypothetical protein BC938DRAFT_481128 [Jimgerdemannia flammicorona]|uniref:UspA domain-containing protein n=1 Tax=Jimgerdemannia flammicorona TaxID=994334 RepID=A0A433QGX4_9FUNG|nr:hypothetical protein BC938DRAFT_481128 [Jimgerdemannia flammicorona]
MSLPTDYDTPGASIPLHERRKVLIAFDNSPTAVKAYKWCLQKLLVPGQDHVLLTAVIDPDRPKQWYEPVSIEQAVEEELFMEMNMRRRLREIEENTQAILEDIAREIRAATAATTQIVVLSGRAPGPILCKCAEDARVDVLVVGTRGLSILKSNSGFRQRLLRSQFQVCRHRRQDRQHHRLAAEESAKICGQSLYLLGSDWKRPEGVFQ